MRSKHRGLAESQRRCGYLFTLPFLIGSVLFILYPVLLSLAFSFSNVTASETGRQLIFIGIENYRQILTVDPDYVRELISTLGVSIAQIPVVVIFSFFIASLLNQKFRGRSVVRAILFLPMFFSSPLIMGMNNAERISRTVQQQAAEGTSVTDFTTVFSQLLDELNLSDNIITLLTDTINNIGTILFLSAIPIVLFLSGLQSVSTSIYEAAFVEGATSWEVFWKISLPMVSPIVLVTIIYCFIDSFTGTSNTIINLIRNACYTSFDLGQGSAMAWIYLVAAACLLAVIYIIVNHFVFYYDD